MWDVKSWKKDGSYVVILYLLIIIIRAEYGVL
jgi:hypothetical protein